MRHPPPLTTCLALPDHHRRHRLCVGHVQLWSGADIEPFMIRWTTGGGSRGGCHAGAVSRRHPPPDFQSLLALGIRHEVEGELGTGRTLGIYLCWRPGRSRPNSPSSASGIGLSGVGLWAVRPPLGSQPNRSAVSRCRRPPDGPTDGRLVLPLHRADGDERMPVANVAHGAGCVLGALLGWAIGCRGLPAAAKRRRPGRRVPALPGGRNRRTSLRKLLQRLGQRLGVSRLSRPWRGRSAASRRPCTRRPSPSTQTDRLVESISG